MANRNLVILRCGRSSLHAHWLKGETERNWDLVLCPFQDIAPEPASIIPPFQVQGQKWLGIFQLLAAWPGWRDYDYIWLPDDDLLADSDQINRLFDLSQAFDTKISAPALSEDSFYSHEIAMRNNSFFAREVTFIEIMMPCVRRDILEFFLPVIEHSKTGYGWGMDFVWPRMINYEGLVIFDCIAIRHTRPIGATRDGALVDLGNQEMKDIVAAHYAPEIYKVLGAWDANKHYRKADGQGFLLDYLNGYRYLIEKHRHLLTTFIDRQNALVPRPIFKRPLEPNIALKKPALVSSVSPWSRSQDRAQEAAGGNDGNIKGGFGFHTLYETDPWWEVDLQGDFLIEQVIVFNCLEKKAGCRHLAVLGSDDREVWNVRAIKDDDIIFGGADGDPYVFEFASPFPARFIRVQMNGVGFLHLDEIEVYGEKISV